MDCVRASKLTSLHGSKIRQVDGRGLFTCNRKADCEDSAAACAIAARNVPAVLANNTVRSAQAKSDALAYGLGSVERIEDVFRLKQSASTVGEFDLDMLVHHAQGDDERT